jgi:2-hydroxychromene-2-carboxylate isomerase
VRNGYASRLARDWTFANLPTSSLTERNLSASNWCVGLRQFWGSGAFLILMGVVIELKERVSARSGSEVPKPQLRVADRSRRRLARRSASGSGAPGRAWRSASGPGRGERPAFFFDLACPFSYLAAEQVQRTLGQVDWIPATSDEPWGRLEAACAHAQGRATALRLPLVWPERFPAPVPRALRAATYAAELGAGDRFALAASRLAFCGGFDLDDSDVLAEAAAAAGLPIHACVAAADDLARDVVLRATAWSLLARGVTRLPAFRVGRHFLQGERAVEAAALMRPRMADETSLAPVC